MREGDKERRGGDDRTGVVGDEERRIQFNSVYL